MEKYQTEKFPRVFLTADVVVFAVEQNSKISKSVLLVQRKKDPYKSAWALPGGFFDLADETIFSTAVRELREETNIDLRIEY